jgi:mono/diheme cytochrome c family protein
MSSAQKPEFDTNREEAVDVTNLHRAVLRESEEPEDGHEAVPFSWLLMSLALALACGFYLAQYSAGFQGKQYDGMPITLSSPGSGGGKAVAAAVVDPKVLGKRVFNNCIACHQSNGQGLEGAFPPLVKSEWVLGKPAALIRILLWGLNGPVEVLGKTYNAAMPAWGRLPDEDIAAVLTYIRSNWGNSADAINAEAVASVRKETSKQSTPFQASELLPLR